MSKFLYGILLLTVVALMACAGPEPTPVPTSTPVPEPTPTPTPEPTATPTPAPTATSEPTATPEPTPTSEPAAMAPQGAESSGAIAPLRMDAPQAFLAELSRAEQACVSENVAPDRLQALLASPDLATPEEGAALVQCLEDETLTRLFLTGLIGGMGPLSDDTSACIRSGFAGLDLRSTMTATTGGAGEAAGMMGSMAAFFLTLSCLSEEEWQTAAPYIGMNPDDRKGLECVMNELGGPEGVAAALQPADGGPPMAFFAAAQKCELAMGPGGPPG